MPLLCRAGDWDVAPLYQGAAWAFPALPLWGEPHLVVAGAVRSN